MDYLAGIDLGSTTLKAVIYDLAGNVVVSACRPTERFHPDPEHPEWTVWQPEQIWGDSAAAMHEAVSVLADPRSVKGVAVTGMGMDGVPVDEAGKWLYPFISWHCPRTQPQFDWWVKHIGAEKTFSIGGNTLWRFSTALRLLLMAEYEPEILKNTHRWLLDIVRTLQGAGVPFDQLVVVGGVAHNKFWMQNKADMVGLPLEVPGVEDATPLGAAMLAGIGVGLYRDEQDAYEHVCRPGTVYRPDPEATKQYEDLFKIYKQIYPALAPISRQLYDQFL